MSRWGEQQSCKFVALYRDCECLWNVFHPDYKDRRARDRAFEKLADAMAIPEFTAKDVGKKIRSFRSTYNQEMAKIAKSEENEDGTPVYKPTIKWLNDMEYILTHRNANADKTTDDTDHYQNKDASNDTEEYAVLETALAVGETVLYTSDFEETQDKPENGNEPEQPKKRYKPQHVPARLKRKTKNKHTSNALCLSSTLSTSSGGARGDDECDVIGKHVAIQLRQLPVEYMIDANLEIQNILAKYRKKYTLQK